MCQRSEKVCRIGGLELVVAVQQVYLLYDRTAYKWLHHYRMGGWVYTKAMAAAWLRRGPGAAPTPTIGFERAKKKTNPFILLLCSALADLAALTEISCDGHVVCFVDEPMKKTHNQSVRGRRRKGVRRFRGWSLLVASPLPLSVRLGLPPRPPWAHLALSVL